MRKPLVVAAALVCALVISPIVLARLAQPFEGTKWKVKVTPDDEAHRTGAKEFDDVLIFKGGKFTATEWFAKLGFEPVDYNEEMSPGGFTATFTAEPKSEKEGAAKWRGTISVGEMTGELTWTKKDGTVLNHLFKGERISR
jgi:hypothetical protein